MPHRPNHASAPRTPHIKPRANPQCLPICTTAISAANAPVRRCCTYSCRLQQHHAHRIPLLPTSHSSAAHSANKAYPERLPPASTRNNLPTQCTALFSSCQQALKLPSNFESHKVCRHANHDAHNKTRRSHAHQHHHHHLTLDANTQQTAPRVARSTLLALYTASIVMRTAARRRPPARPTQRLLVR